MIHGFAFFEPFHIFPAMGGLLLMFFREGLLYQYIHIYIFPSCIPLLRFTYLLPVSPFLTVCTLFFPYSSQMFFGCSLDTGYILHPHHLTIP